MKKIYLSILILLVSISFADAGMHKQRARQFKEDAGLVLWVHADGADASTTFVNSASTSHTLTAVGNGQVDTAQSKFGGASYLGDGTTDGVMVTDNVSDFVFGANPFTIEAWIYLNEAIGTARSPFSFGGATASWNVSGGFQWFLYYHTDGTLYFQYFDGDSSPSFTTPTAATLTGGFHYLQLINSNTAFNIFVDGATIYSGANISISASELPTTMGVGAVPNAPTYSFSWNGWMDEMRVLKGNAVNRYMPVPYAIKTSL